MNSRALVIGISKYKSTIEPLPGVANDVAEIGKLLSSDDGAFDRNGVCTLLDEKASRSSVLEALEKTLVAQEEDTVFVYLAGHGSVEDDDYYFIPFDINVSDLKSTAVPLNEIRRMFEQTKSRRAFLWLDFCHSGGIFARDLSRTNHIDLVRRTLEAVSGEGKVIFTACSSNESAYESPLIGHGLFTHALLRGLKGEAEANGEVTANSLYDFIDREVDHPDQQPESLGHLKGRIVLMNYTDRSSKNNDSTSNHPEIIAGNWVMLGDSFFVAKKISRTSSGEYELLIVPQDLREEATLSKLCPTDSWGSSDLPFAEKNEGCFVRISESSSESIEIDKVEWSLKLDIVKIDHSVMHEIAYENVTPDEIANLRGRRLLFGDSLEESSELEASIIDHAIQGGSNVPESYRVTDSIIRRTYNENPNSPYWRDFARLKSIFVLKITMTIKHLHHFEIGNVKDGSVKVIVRGERPQHYTNQDPTIVEFDDFCDLS